MSDLATIFLSLAIVVIATEPDSPMLRSVAMILAMAAILLLTIYPLYF